MDPAPPALEFRGVSKVFLTEAGAARPALRDVTLAIAAGQKVAVVGRSGSGKSTLLHLAAGIDVPTTGEVLVGGRPLSGLSDAERTRLRRHEVGLVFQFFHLLPHLSVQENVALPGLIAGGSLDSCAGRVRELLTRVGLADRADERVQRLSGGEQQRVAICRALLAKPRLLLADEPTGNLDDETSRTVMDLLLELVEQEGAALVCVTHSAEVAGRTDRRLRLHSGILEPEAA